MAKKSDQPAIASLPFEEGGVETEDVGGNEIIREPFDPTRIRVEPKPLTVDLLMQRVQHNELDLTPDFQRKAGLWSNAAQSRLVESLLIRIPLPAFYMDATDEDRWLVVDGLQRITSLKRFILDKTLALHGMEFLTNLNGKQFDQLPRNFQRRILETQITLYLIEKGTPPEVKFNIFKRINTGGLPLSAQEIRHALNQGKVTELLANLGNSDEFKQATSYSIRDDRMADREFVLRFLAFATTPYTEFKASDFDSFLNQKMQEINKFTDKELRNLSDRFRRSMLAAYNLFGDAAFRKWSAFGRRMPINKALFEAWTVALDKLSDEQLNRLLGRKSNLAARFAELEKDWEFTQSISQGTGDITKVKTRFSRIESLVQGVLA